MNRPLVLGRSKYGEKNQDALESYTLMHKNTEVSDFVYHIKNRSVVEIGTPKHLDLAPFSSDPKSREKTPMAIAATPLLIDPSEKKSAILSRAHPSNSSVEK